MSVSAEVAAAALLIAVPIAFNVAFFELGRVRLPEHPAQGA
jgi:ABC-type phosphate transport system permease subunit